MNKYVAFLRGINVGNIRIKMSDLQLTFEKLTLRNVKTYLQTGNVVFDTDKPIPEVKQILEKELSSRFQYDAYVLLINFFEVESIISNYPFLQVENTHAYIIFVDNELILNELFHLSQSIEREQKKVLMGKNILYLEVEKGESTNTSFSKILAKTKYKSSTTIRNINTLEKIIATK